MQTKTSRQIAENRQARHNYFILDTIECGIELVGTEVKSLRAGTVNLKDSFAFISKDMQLYVANMHISPYEKGNIFNHNPLRERRLLVHKKEVLKLQSQVMKDGMALVPISLYFSHGKVKLNLGICKGKKLYDKRESAAERDAKRDMDRVQKTQRYSDD